MRHTLPRREKSASTNRRSPLCSDGIQPARRIGKGLAVAGAQLHFLPARGNLKRLANLFKLA